AGGSRCSRRRRRQGRERGQRTLSMTPDFIIMLIGEGSDPRRVALADELDGRTRDALRASGERLDVIDQQARVALTAKVPRVAVVFCRVNMSDAEIDAIKICRDGGI